MSTKSKKCVYCVYMKYNFCRFVLYLGHFFLVKYRVSVFALEIKKNKENILSKFIVYRMYLNALYV